MRAFANLAPRAALFSVGSKGLNRHLLTRATRSRHGIADETQRATAWVAGLRILAMGLCAISLSGCAAVLVGGAIAAGAAAGVGAEAYSKGELRSLESVSLDQAWIAVPAAMKDAGVAVVDKSKDPLNANVEGSSEANKRVMVKLKNAGKQLTEVRIRVGTFGDEGLSRQILEGMRKHCSAATSKS
jgi:hypothetical protein